jgi:hypothetical protein
VRLGGVEADDRAGDMAFGHLYAIYDELAANGKPEFGDIWVQCFSVGIDGIRYELRYERCEDGDEEDWYESVQFWPWDIMFHPPWDSGEYSTWPRRTVALQMPGPVSVPRCTMLLGGRASERDVRPCCPEVSYGTQTQ